MTSQTRTSPPPETSRLPSGWNATERTGTVCPRYAASSLPVSASHTRTVVSAPPVTSRLPSADQATARTGPRCPWNRRSSSPLVPHTRAVPSSLAVATKRLLGENATHPTPPVWPRSTAFSSPVRVSHSRATGGSVPALRPIDTSSGAAPPEAAQIPTRAIATDRTALP